MKAVLRLGVAVSAIVAVCGCRPLDVLSTTRNQASPLRPPIEATDLDPAPDRLEVELVAEQAPDGSFRYSGARPGPTLRARVGDRVTVRLVNALDVPTTIHWHGVGVPNAMDGVPFVSGTVAPGERFVYRFDVERAGTFWYHPHFDTARQVDRGLYGLFVVEDPAEPELPELLLVLDDPDEGGPHPAHGHGALARGWTVNGAPAPVVHRLPRGERLRVRVLNASNAAYLWLHPEGLGLRVLATDQGLQGGISDARPLLAPGDRVELELAVEDAAALFTRAWSLNGGAVPWAGSQALVRFGVDVPSAAPPAPAWPHDGAAVSEDPGQTDVVWTFVGSDRSGRWTIDGETFPDVTPEVLPLGVPAIVEVRNMSPTEHPFHPHGFPFEVLSINGRKPAFRTIEDTVNVGIRERVRLRVVPDRAGTWMVHCHILPHADAGMMTLLEVPEGE